MYPRNFVFLQQERLDRAILEPVAVSILAKAARHRGRGVA